MLVMPSASVTDVVATIVFWPAMLPIAGYLEPIKTACAPYTRHLPSAAQEFLDGGGWWLVLIALVVAVGFWLRDLWRRLRRAMSYKSTRHRKRPAHDQDSPLIIDLDQVGATLTDPGPQRITVRGQPAPLRLVALPGPQQIMVRGQPGRLRLVVLASSPSFVGDLLPEMAESLLDWLRPGLGEILDADQPRQVVWPCQPSLDCFVHRLHQLVRIPEVKSRRTPWVLISGAVHLGRQTVFLGLAVFLYKTSYQREIQVDKETWNELFDVQKVTEDV
jgi:hypothetical protein